MKKKNFISIMILLIIVFIFPLIIRNTFQQELLVMTLIFTILALSLDLIVGHMGQFSFGHQAFFGIGAYTSSILTLKLGVSVWIGFAASLTLCAIIGYFLGFIALRRSKGMALAIITLGFGTIVALVVSRSYNITGGMAGLYNVPKPKIVLPSLFEFEFRSGISYYYLTLVILLLIIFLINRLLRSRFGRALIALRENEDLASSVGISPLRHHVLTFTLACSLAGLAGALWAHRLGGVNPSFNSLYYMTMMLTIVLVGGTGTLLGPFIGAFIVVFIPQNLPVSLDIRFLIFGIILLIVIRLMPKGIYPFLKSMYDKLFLKISQRQNE